MPKKLHAELARQARKKDVEDKDAYVYGTLNKIKKRKKMTARQHAKQMKEN